MQLTGATRKALGGYEKAGICTPLRNPDNTLMWTFDQVGHIEQVRLLQRSGVSLDQISELCAGEPGDFPNAAMRTRVVESREARRGIKRNLLFKHMMQGLLPVADIDGFYLRYIPQRWVALMPLSQERPVLVGSDQWSRASVDLKDVVDVCGWSRANIIGSLCSYSASAQALTSYAYRELASPPMPSIGETFTADGGCYQAFDDAARCKGWKPGSCDMCTHFGRAATLAELNYWNGGATAHDASVVRAPAAESFETPYEDGPWRECLQQLLGAETPDGPYGQPAAEEAVRTPQFMPVQTELPMNIAVATLPAGVYLCQHCTEGGQHDIFQQMLGLTQALARSEGNPMPVPGTTAYTDAGAPHGPSVEPWAVPASPSDARFDAWSMPLQPGGISRLALPEGMALAPEDGFVMWCQVLPNVDHRLPKYEMQLLVDARAFTDDAEKQVL